MPTYLSTFQTGFTDLIRTILPTYLKDAKINLALDGLITYHTSANINQIRQLRFFNNSFLLLNQLPSADLAAVLKVAALSNIQSIIANTMPQKITTFRVMTYQDNQPIAADKKLIGALEQKLRRLPNFYLHKSNSKVEFWCFTRREGYAFFALRLTRNPNYEKTLHPGELRPELANLLCQLSHPKPTDVFLDPFAGYGSIPFERARMYQADQIIAGDLDKNLITELQRDAKKTLPRPVAIKQLDATSTNLPNNAVTTIVTDPPWGLYDKTTDLTALYLAMLTEFHRILKPKGIAVILIAQPDLITNTLKANPIFTIETKIPTLVSSQKASVLKLHKTS